MTGQARPFVESSEVILTVHAVKVVLKSCLSWEMGSRQARGKHGQKQLLKLDLVRT